MENPDQRSCAYGLRHQTRCLSAVWSNDGKSRFIIGTQELLKPNEVHLLTFDEEAFEISTTVFSHPNEIWDISASKDDPSLFFTCHKEVVDGTKIKSRASLWRIKSAHVESSEDDSERRHHHEHTGELELVLSLDVGDNSIKKIIWQDNSEVLSIEDWRICIWDIDVKQGTAKLTGTIDAPDKEYKFTSAVMNPHSQEVVAVYGRSIQGWNLSSLKPTFTIKNSQPALILCVDYNPNRPFQIAVGGEDCKVRIWDVRDTSSGPILTIQDHTHWVWSVAYNKFHDQLLLTSSSDSQVNLQSIVSISTGAEYHNYHDNNDPDQDQEVEDARSESGQQDMPSDGLVRAFDQHEDSVYQVAWSKVDPWLFLSLSYDGRAVMNQVPSEEKFKIIMN
ncbi:Protein tssc1 [Lunasporangiospora selenospora]|uniref:Protein tssc1 n=1 Tax=Lunasporangiospora selenospora TaxID=979761 RepID=A0A9P6FZT8_9FUNG|nr:Protein tssc1 [Lunasporangiospora selenospora]